MTSRELLAPPAGLRYSASEREVMRISPRAMSMVPVKLNIARLSKVYCAAIVSNHAAPRPLRARRTNVCEATSWSVNVREEGGCPSKTA